MKIRLNDKEIHLEKDKYYVNVSFWSIVKVVLLANALLLLLEVILIIIGANARVI